MENLHGHQKIPGAKNPLVVKFADAKNKDGSDSQVGAKRPINEDPWVSSAKRPFHSQANVTPAAAYPGFQGTMGLGAAWPQAGQLGPYGYQGMGRGMGFQNLMGNMASGSMMGMGIGTAYPMGAGAYPTGYTGGAYGTAYGGMLGNGALMNNVLGGMTGMAGMNGMLGMPGTGVALMSSGAPPGGAGGKLGPGITDPRANEWKLFVGQVPYDATEADLWPLFSNLGDILELVILRTNEGRSRGCAFVTYADRPTAERAIGRFNGQVSVPGDTRGKKLVVSFAAPKKESGWNGAGGHQKVDV
ncbi:unnamed protein product [Ostreobium quekettii]|uniref:RRM domain-containing protein n=1 Tax=Ostreobium quekettii TaxID=121088 RepID=A0A8S1IPF8_9CHLO|nr:unnamed protein product [Ostreobium quekettii]